MEILDFAIGVFNQISCPGNSSDGQQTAFKPVSESLRTLLSITSIELDFAGLAPLFLTQFLYLADAIIKSVLGKHVASCLIKTAHRLITIIPGPYRGAAVGACALPHVSNLIADHEMT